MSTKTRARAQRKQRVPAAVLKPPKPIATLRGDSSATIVLDGATVDLKADGAILDANVERTIEGGSTVSLDIHDDAEILTHSGILDRDRDELLDQGVIVTVDGLSFVLARVEADWPSYNLTFEDEPVVWLKTPDKPRKAYRDKVTRAEFAWQLIREVGLPAYIPELRDRQAIARGEATADTTASESSADRRPGFSPGANVKVKGAKANRAQLGNIDKVLGEAYRRKASERVMIACVMTITNESNATNVNHGDAVGPDSTGLFQQRDPWGPRSVRMNPTGATGLFLDAWKRVHGSLKADSGDLGARIYRVQIGGSPATFDRWQPEATRTVKAWLGGAGGLVSSRHATSKEVTGRYAFTRGQQGKRETSWACLQRLATEVGWRCFVVGRTVIFASEEELLRQRPQMTLFKGAPGVEKIGWTWDRAHTVQEATVSGRASRWGAQPGQCVELVDEGPATGRWLVANVSRSLFKPDCEIKLVRPQRKKPEPAAETKTVTIPGISSSSDRAAVPTGKSSVYDKVYAEAVRISRRNMPYAWGGGHGRIGVPSGGGFDCSGYVSAMLHAGGLLDTPMTSGALASWGEPGVGKYFTVYANGEHVFVEFYGRNFKRADTSPQGGETQRGPHVRTAHRGHGGFTARHAKGL